MERLGANEANMLNRSPSWIPAFVVALAPALVLGFVRPSEAQAPPTGAPVAAPEEVVVDEAADVVPENIVVDATEERPAEAEPLAEVVVSAEFRERSVQQTPLSITTMDRRALGERGLKTVAEVGAYAPNVTLSPQGQFFGAATAASIRGVGQFDSSLAVEPGVGMYVDDVYYATLFGSILDLIDLERVEILRGPQGTLTGKNSIGGAIKLFSRKPTGDQPSFLEASLGRFDAIGVRGAAEFTLVPEQLFGRVSVVSRRRGGYVDRYDYECVNRGSGLNARVTQPGCKIGSLGGQNVHGVRAILRWAPGDDFELTLTGDATYDDSDAAASELVRVGGGPAAPIVDPVSGVAFGPQFVYPPGYRSYATFADPATGTSFEPKSTVFAWGTSANLDWRLSTGWSLKSIAAYRTHHGAFAQDNDDSPINVSLLNNINENRQISEELRLDVDLLDSALLWTLGGFFIDQRGRSAGRKILRLVSIDYVDDDGVESRSLAAFTHVSVSPIERLTLAGGFRLTAEQKTYRYDRTDSATGAPYALTAAIQGRTGRYPLDGGYELVPDFRGVAQYQWAPELMTYTQIASGFKGGGVNPRPFSAEQALPFGPEKLTAYEVGAKSDLFDRSLRVNLAAFYNRYRDIQQVLLSFVNPTTGGVEPSALPQNVGDATVMGIELEVAVEPLRLLRLDLAGSYIDFEYTRSDLAATGVASEMTAPYTPRYKGSAGAQYGVPLAGAGTLTPRIDATYQSEMWAAAVNADTNHIGERTLINARLTYVSADVLWEIAGAATNLLNQHYYFNLTDSTVNAGIVQAQPGPPISWELSVRRSFF